MKKSLVALALFGAFAGAAHAQSSVAIYGTIDAGLGKATGKTTAVTKRDNNKLGFKGVEDLGNGLKALFQLEIRYESDTGQLENGSNGSQRPLFQGQSRVGLQGDFGTVRLGRGLTAFQESSTAFEPWSGMPTQVGFQSDLHTGGYNSDPQGGTVSSKNRFSNAIFYNTPVMSGFQVNATVATKEATAVPVTENPSVVGDAKVSPYSLSATYTNGPFAGMAAYERNAAETKVWSVAASVNPIQDLKLMASYTKQDQSKSVAVNPNTKSWVIGANYTVGAGLIRAGYGQKTPDGVTKTKQASLGYEYNLSKRTYVYADVSQKKIATSVNYYGVGLHHNF
ncbi:porin [Janthinobacterium fluminis]|uniref:Porin n=1 Tax=Janthinobacterium fluminis TaxID=2987524 RepID=A0ABT5K611_9BURK|nr:porin [Janthinobacterium fluminis]MDC8760442.1 porin [Janthinobacterium fluminis]